MWEDDYEEGKEATMVLYKALTQYFSEGTKRSWKTVG
jgi:hypothetical protein